MPPISENKWRDIWPGGWGPTQVTPGRRLTIRDIFVTQPPPLALFLLTIPAMGGWGYGWGWGTPHPLPISYMRVYAYVPIDTHNGALITCTIGTDMGLPRHGYGCAVDSALSRMLSACRGLRHAVLTRDYVIGRAQTP